MQFTIQKTVKSFTSWNPYYDGVILVKSEIDKEQLWQLLCAQDDYWEDYKHIIKVFNGIIDSESDLDLMCFSVGKTDIYDIAAIQKSVDCFIWQCE